ncbi:MAG: fumarylacetoacetate hydrolase family protein [Actinomycetota bacterium]
MRIASIRTDGGEFAAVDTGAGFALLGTSVTVLDVIAQPDALPASTHATDPLASNRTSFAPPYRRPGKIWCIGLNYTAHARSLDEEVPKLPGSFLRPPNTIIGPGDAIVLPDGVGRVTVEAELAVIIGSRCRDVDRVGAEASIFGYTCVLDVTAEDILRQNPRYLTRAKSFDSFFSFGPVIVTRADVPDVSPLVVRTVVNGEVRAENSVANMTFDPIELVRYHSRATTLEPGDIISTGTPGAWPIEPGDVARCEIDGFPPLENPVAAERPNRKG